MFSILIALIVLAIAVGSIYLVLKNMGEEGVEIAAPGSCKSGRCGVRCAPLTNDSVEVTEAMSNVVDVADEVDEVRRKDAA